MAHLSLRAKSLVALALACLLVLLPALLLGWQISDRIRLHFAQAYGDNLTLLNRQKILAPITIDLALSRRLANSEVTRQWLADEDNPVHHKLFFRETESLRRELRDRAYFIAIAGSGNYYFNAQDETFSAEPRYTLRQDDIADSWFYATLQDSSPYNINVNPDPKLGVTRVWINVQIRDGERALGISGASLDLTEFLNSLTAGVQPGVVPMIVDAAGAIQAHVDPRRIAFNSGAAPGGALSPAAASADDQSSLFASLLPADAVALRNAMVMARQQPDSAHAIRVTLDDTVQLMSVAHVPELDWYIVTSVDPTAAQVVDTHWMWAALAGIVVLMAALMAAFGYGVERLVLRPIRRLQQSARAVADGNYKIALPQRGNDEIADLSRAFNDMAARISAHTATLEDRVRERTTELEAAN
nr:HAMP domain-containing protein [Pseudomonas sp.]